MRIIHTRLGQAVSVGLRYLWMSVDHSVAGSVDGQVVFNCYAALC